MLFYFAGSLGSEDLNEEIKSSDELGILFTFADIPKKRWIGAKKIMKKQNKQTKGKQK